MLGRVQCTKFDCFGHVGTFHFFVRAPYIYVFRVFKKGVRIFNTPHPPPPPSLGNPQELIFLDRPAQIPITLAQLNAGKKLATQNFNANLH